MYTTGSGRSPVEEFLDDLSAQDAARAEVELRLLAEFGTALGMPHVRPVTGEIWELRIRGRIQHRVLYVAASGQQMLLLHAFSKKVEGTPRREIKIATDRLADYRRRNGI
jgi:phage-related protein